MNLSHFIDKTENFEKLSQIEQVKLMAYFFITIHNVHVFKGSDIKKCFENEDLLIPSNISREISNLLKEKVIVPKGKSYSLHRAVKKELDKIFLDSKLIRKTNVELRELANKLKGGNQKDFLNEVIDCFEVDARRASIIMIWLLTVDTLFEFIIKKKLKNFNDAIQAHGKYRKITITKKDDFNEIKEIDFIEVMKVAKIITNDERKILDVKLGIRNTCAHPNSIKISKTSVIAYIEDLVGNIINKFT